MRNSNIQNSIANVVSRFSARVNAMLRMVTDLQHPWHVQPSALPVLLGRSGSLGRFRNLGMLGVFATGTDLPAIYLPATSEPCEITGKMVRQPSFQRLG